MQRCKLHVMGASGSGTSTLARALADHWSVPHADADDYFWVPTDPPYVEKRDEAARVSLMREVFVPREAWVLSGSMTGWGEAVVDECDAIVFLTLDPDERLRRLEAREVHRRAGRGFDEDAWAAFLDWARGATTTPPSRDAAASPTTRGSRGAPNPCSASTARPALRSWWRPCSTGVPRSRHRLVA